MSLISIFIAIGALLLGAVIGYYLRRVIALGQRRSIEIDIKQMMVGAREESQKIVEEAKKKAEERKEELKDEEKKKEVEFKETEKRFIKKEELLDARQVEIDKEVENIKLKIEEIKKIKEKTELAASEKQAELEKKQLFASLQRLGLIIGEVKLESVLELTIKDVMQSISFPVILSEDAGRLIGDSTFAINKALWGIKSLGDKPVKDAVSIELHIEAVR